MRLRGDLSGRNSTFTGKYSTLSLNASVRVPDQHDGQVNAVQAALLADGRIAVT